MCVLISRASLCMCVCVCWVFCVFRVFGPWCPFCVGSVVCLGCYVTCCDLWTAIRLREYTHSLPVQITTAKASLCTEQTPSVSKASSWHVPDMPLGKYSQHLCTVAVCHGNEPWLANQCFLSVRVIISTPEFPTLPSATIPMHSNARPVFRGWGLFCSTNIKTSIPTSTLRFIPKKHTANQSWPWRGIRFGTGSAMERNHGMQTNGFKCQGFAYFQIIPTPK